MSETKSNQKHQGHHSGPQGLSDQPAGNSQQPRGSAEKHSGQQKSNVNDTRPAHQSNPGQHDKHGQHTGDCCGQKEPGQHKEKGRSAGPAIPGHGAESPGMSHGSKTSSFELQSDDEDQDEREEAAEKAPFIGGQTSPVGATTGGKNAHVRSDRK